LNSFTTISPHDASWPTWLRWEKLAQGSEPDADYPIYDYLDRRVVERIARHPRRLPSGANETASVLLFGPPGTSKTTLVQAVADRLGWPIVFLSPGTFIEQGLEAIEAAAQSVFERLHALRRAVVIFDECDELFRDRRPSTTTEQLRNISAFVTASMLPKLQDLRDRGTVLFFICTNHAEMIDPAVLRGGRIDHRIGVGPPDRIAREAIIDSFRHELPDAEHLEPALKELAFRAERFSRGELKRAALKLVAAGPWETDRHAVRAAERVVEGMQEALTISEDLMSEFIEQKKRMSDPYMEKAP
jgi:SpoVK/Ycf46/Vps4 family AAA+-type ATPase